MSLQKYRSRELYDRNTAAAKVYKDAQEYQCRAERYRNRARRLFRLNVFFAVFFAIALFGLTARWVWSVWNV